MASPVPAEMSAEAPAVLTDRISTEEFAVMGVTWADEGVGARRTRVQVRVHEADGWTPWTPLPVVDDGPDAGTEEAARAADVVATEPLVTADADGVQVRVETVDGEAPADLEAVLVDPGESAADGAGTTSTPLSGAGASVARPAIITRAQWGAAAGRCSTSYSSTVVAATVHHTAGSNDYTAAQSAGLVRGIQSYHQGALGWCDVGYNFLVDKYGQVFEGRGGGMDRPVVGAHAGGFNDRTFGISALGNYELVAAPPAMVSAIARVAGWKLALYGRSVGASVTLTSAGGGTSRYSAGTKVTLPNIFGHRDVGLTACPGKNLYAQLGSIRSQAAAYQASAEDGQHGDLFAVTAGGASDAVELHADSRSSSFRNRMVSVASGLAGQNPDQWRFFVGSYRGDTRPDLIAVRAAGASSGKVEVSVYSWASGYRSRVLSTTAPLAAFTPDRRWQIDVSTGPDGRADLVFVDTAGAGGMMDVHILSAASDYSTFSLQTGTAFASGYAQGEVKLLMDDDRNLWLIKHGGTTGTGKMELHVVSASSGYQTFTLHRGVPAELGPLTKWAFTTGDYTGDGIQDLYLLKVGETGSGRSEVHVLTGSSQYRRVRPAPRDLAARAAVPGVAGVDRLSPRAPAGQRSRSSHRAATSRRRPGSGHSRRRSASVRGSSTSAARSARSLTPTRGRVSGRAACHATASGKRSQDRHTTAAGAWRVNVSSALRSLWKRNTGLVVPLLAASSCSTTASGTCSTRSPAARIRHDRSTSS